MQALRARPGDVAVAVSACVALAWACERKLVPAPAEVADLMGAFVMVMREYYIYMLECMYIHVCTYTYMYIFYIHIIYKFVPAAAELQI